MKYFLKVYGIIAVTFILALMVLFSTASDDEQSGHIKVIIADRTFKIPKGYLDGAKAWGKDTESIVLEYSLPGFEVLPPHPQEREERQKLINEGRMRGLLLENSSVRPSFDVMVANSTRSPRWQQAEQEYYGLEKLYVPKNPDEEHNRLYDDMFIERNADGSVVSFLRCASEVKIPSCSHKFRDKGILYDISWRIQELPNWKQQQEAAIRFIDGFEVEKTTLISD